MLKTEGTLDQHMLRDSLYLCVRSVRQMTEQLCAVVSSLKEVASSFDCPRDRRVCRTMRYSLESPPPYLYSGEETCSSLCSFSSLCCHCMDDYCQKKALLQSIQSPIDNESSKKNMSVLGVQEEYTGVSQRSSLPQNEATDNKLSSKRSLHSLPINSASQTVRFTQDKQSFTTPDAGTQTIQASKIDPFILSNNPDIFIETMSTKKSGGREPSGKQLQSDLSTRPTYLDNLMKSQIEDAVNKKLSERLLVPFLGTTRNSDHTSSEVLTIKPDISESKMSIKESTRLITEDDGLKTVSQKEVGSRKILRDSERESMKGKSGRSVVTTGESSRHERPDNTERSHRTTVQGTRYENFDVGLKISGINAKSNASVPQTNSHARSNDILMSTATEHKLEMVRRASLRDSPADLASFSKEDKNANGNRKFLLKYNKSVNKDIFEFSTFDDFDHVSDADLMTVSSSVVTPRPTSSTHEGMSLYNSTTAMNPRGNEFEKLSNRTENTVSFSEVVDTTSDLSAFSTKVSSKANTVSKNPQLFHTSNTIGRFSTKSDLTDISSQSQSKRYMHNIKSINSLSTSVKEKYVQYKTINVTYMERNHSNNSPERKTSRLCGALLNHESTQKKEPSSDSLGLTRLDTDCGRPSFKMYDEEELGYPLANLHMNRHNSEANMFKEEIFVEILEEPEGPPSDLERTSGRLDGFNVIDFSESLRISKNDNESTFSDQLRSLYCDVERHQEPEVIIDHGAKDRYPDQHTCCLNSVDDVLFQDRSKTETIFLQATPEGDTQCRVFESALPSWKIEGILPRSLRTLKVLNRAVSCFDGNKMSNLGNKRMKRSKKELKFKDKQLANRNCKKKKKRKNENTNCSLIECILEDSQGRLGPRSVHRLDP